MPIYALIFNISVNNRQPCITKQTGELNMTDRAQFEAMLEALINDDTDQAKEIFHNIVVSKSREIYEELLAEDFSQDSGNPYGKKEEEEVSEEEEAPMEGEEEEEGEEPADDAEDDAEDDSEEDGEEDPFASDEEGEEGGDMEDRVMDLEDALEDLKAEFEQLLSQEDEEGGHDIGAIHDAGDDAMGGMDAEMDDMEGFEPEPVMEYYKKVSVTHGDNGQNTRSAVAGKNDMGGTTANIAKSFSTTSGGTQGGLANPKTGDLTSGLGTVHNRVNSNAGKTAFKKSEPGHGAEKKGERPGKMAGARTGEMGGQRGEQSTQSMINGAPKRAK